MLSVHRPSILSYEASFLPVTPLILLKIPTQRGRISKRVCASIKAEIKSISLQTQLAPLSVTSWSVSHLTHEAVGKAGVAVLRAPWPAVSKKGDQLPRTLEGVSPSCLPGGGVCSQAWG